MSKIISAQVSGELEDKFAEAAERRGADESKSAFIRDVIGEGLRAREVPLFARLDLPNRMAAKLEADREDGESQEAVVVRHLREAIEARERDSLDELGVDDDLREAVEAAREEGEATDDAVRRLLREAAADAESETIRDRILTGVAFFLISGVPALYAAAGEYTSAGFMVFFFISLSVFNKEIDRLTTRIGKLIRNGIGRVRATVKRS